MFDLSLEIFSKLWKRPLVYVILQGIDINSHTSQCVVQLNIADASLREDVRPVLSDEFHRFDKLTKLLARQDAMWVVFESIALLQLLHPSFSAAWSQGQQVIARLPYRFVCVAHKLFHIRTCNRHPFLEVLVECTFLDRV